MRIDQGAKASAASAQDRVGPLDASRQPLYLTFAQAAVYVGAKNVRAFYEWRKRHGVTVEGDGTIARFLLDRVKRRKRQARVMHPNSLAALRRGPLSRRSPKAR